MTSHRAPLGGNSRAAGGAAVATAGAILTDKMKNVAFYSCKIPSTPDGDFIDNIHKSWWGNYNLLEEHHGYIQWLFPISTASQFNDESQPLTEAEAVTFASSPALQNRVLKSYALMLDFYGFTLLDPRSGRLHPSDNSKERWQNLVDHPHNYLRISRILKCLREIGLEKVSYRFLEALITAATTGSQPLKDTMDSLLRYWVPQVSDKSAKEGMIAALRALKPDPPARRPLLATGGGLGPRAFPSSSSSTYLTTSAQYGAHHQQRVAAASRPTVTHDLPPTADNVASRLPISTRYYDGGGGAFRASSATGARRTGSPPAVSLLLPRTTMPTALPASSGVASAASPPQHQAYHRSPTTMQPEDPRQSTATAVFVSGRAGGAVPPHRAYSSAEQARLAPPTHHYTPVAAATPMHSMLGGGAVTRNPAAVARGGGSWVPTATMQMAGPPHPTAGDRLRGLRPVAGATQQRASSYAPRRS